MSTPDYSNHTYIDSLITETFIAHPWHELAPTVIPWPIDSFFLGCLICQLVNYQTSRTRLSDSWILKGAVILAFCLSVTSTALSWTWSTSAILTHTGHYWPYVACKYILPFFITSTVQALIVQAFFTYKAFELYGRRWVILGSVGFFSVLGAAGGFGMTAILAQISTLFQNTSAGGKALSYVFYFGFMVSNLMITGLLFKSMVKAPLASKAWIDRSGCLVGLIIETILPVSVLAVITAIHFAVTNELTMAIPYLQLSGKLYTVSMLFSLNTREGPEDELEFSTSQAETAQSQLRSRNTYFDALKHNQLASRQDHSMTVAVETYVEICEDKGMPDQRRHAGLRDTDSEPQEGGLEEEIKSLAYGNHPEGSSPDREKSGYSSREDLVRTDTK